MRARRHELNGLVTTWYLATHDSGQDCETEAGRVIESWTDTLGGKWKKRELAFYRETDAVVRVAERIHLRNRHLKCQLNEHSMRAAHVE